MTEATEAAPMTGASFKTTLGALGLPPSWFAERMGVTMRTVVRWFDGDTVSPKVAAELEKLSDATLSEMSDMVDRVGDGDDPVILKTYRVDGEFEQADTSYGRKLPSKFHAMPAEWHRALTFRVMEHFKAQGRTVRIEYQ